MGGSFIERNATTPMTAASRYSSVSSKEDMGRSYSTACTVSPGVYTKGEARRTRAPSRGAPKIRAMSTPTPDTPPAFEPEAMLARARATFDIEGQAVLGLKARVGDGF